ncbi:2216_t:CDS:2 [Cetraspora pellucida]|uniref:2216_t:CDS:1 n=1 Tax=Cetraspora pellucida TaxID=1433469 RepID=A0A9N9HB95_9GLOM|nr:2216_t:CDS:2 [Cetraspora pellucida]
MTTVDAKLYTDYSPRMNKNYDLFLRIGVDGEPNVGKSRLIEKFAENDFKNGVYEENLHVYVTNTHINLENCTIKVEFLETADGLRKIEELSREYTNIDSNYVTNRIPIMIIANKWDEWDKNKQKNRND